MHHAAITVEPERDDRPRWEYPQHQWPFHGDIAEKAGRRLRASPHAALRSIKCGVNEDVLVLRGHVPTYHLKQLAQETVRAIDGVGAIINSVEVIGAPNGSL